MRVLLLLFLSLLIVTCGCTRESDATKSNETEVKKEEIAKQDLSTNDILYGPTDPLYKIDVVYDEKNHELRGNMDVRFHNNLDKTLEHIYFNLWPNAKQLEDGSIEVSNVQLNSKETDFMVQIQC
ncbi:MAG: hypothetical protein ACQEWU_07115 [Bacillota bacterium]